MKHADRMDRMDRVETVFVYNNTENASKKAILREFKHILNMRGFDDPFDINEMQIFCPFCLKMNCIDSTCKDPYLATDDYITHPMIWCDNCCRSVLLVNTAKIVPATQISNEYKNKVENLDTSIFFTVQLAFVKKIVDDILGRFECDVAIPNDEARRFSDDYYDCEGDTEQFLETNEIAKKYNIRLREGHFDDIKDATDDFDNNHNSKFINAKTLNIGIKVGSYNVLEPERSYPRSTNLQSSDVVIRLLCVDERGEDFCANFWGV